MNNLRETSLEYTPWPSNFVARYKSAKLWQESILGELLKPHLNKNKLAIIDDHIGWTYQELERNSDLLASTFLKMGLGQGDKVVVHLPNCCALFELLFALFKIGASPIMALPTHRYGEISYFCEFTQAKAYIGSAQLNEQVNDSVLNQLIDNKLIKFGYTFDFNENFISLNHELKSQTDDLELLNKVKVVPSNIALFQLSGGTTGVPKLIPRTHYDYLYSVIGSNKICNINQNSVYLAVLPVCHNFPMSSPGALGVFAAGGTLVLSNSGAPDNAFSLIEQYKVTISALVPPLAITWLSAFETRKNEKNCPDISSLQVLQVGGAKFSFEAAKRVEPILGCTLQQVFGMAEGLVNYTRLNDDVETILSTQGRPISEFDEIKILDDDDNLVLQGEIGHLLTRGPYTIRGYYKAAEHNLKAFTSDGFYRTGDLVRENENGYLIVEGRAKDQINKGGEKVAAEELENYLLSHSSVFDAAVVAMPDEYLGERICAFVIAKTQLCSPLKSIDLNKFLRSKQLAQFKYPDRFEIVKSFPKTKFGKVDKKALRIQISEKLNKLSAQLSQSSIAEKG
ncbi:(2,3-dihydroxybenzoyl)adenylate synthase [Pseudoalteromonas denitrificans]|uniref:2,3-dihydroxybenzoate-AMP ligase n=1 Tax=Pseudoalteromonas denitrificans DSM 6059 TaxID=1123010 RepID=A0A1I1EJL0_9GAMM|nr:AMP-binding protein [Pseudoalteromonas denitrificans]SFB87339.1 2,3-dihydroxybenzoate-AMP ligase [Pseudoalteromonas denitrificans DSM 6059]